MNQTAVVFSQARKESFFSSGLCLPIMNEKLTEKNLDRIPLRTRWRITIETCHTKKKERELMLKFSNEMKSYVFKNLNIP